MSFDLDLGTFIHTCLFC